MLFYHFFLASRQTLIVTGGGFSTNSSGQRHTMQPLHVGARENERFDLPRADLPLSAAANSDKSSTYFLVAWQLITSTPSTEALCSRRRVRVVDTHQRLYSEANLSSSSFWAVMLAGGMLSFGGEAPESAMNGRVGMAGATPNQLTDQQVTTWSPRHCC